MARPRSKPQEWADTPAEIRKRRTMDVTLPSGLQVTLRTVTLEELAVAEAIPSNLAVAAFLESADMLVPQMVKHIRDEDLAEAQRLSLDVLALRERIVAAALVKPEPTESVLESLDGFDKQMIVELSQRKRNTDAVGKVVAAQAVGDFAGFREEPDRDTDREAGGTGRKVAGAVA